MKRGSCALPLASVWVVVVVEAELTVAVADPSRLSVEPEFEKDRPVEPSALFSYETAEAMPSEKLIPTCWGLALAAFCRGSADGSVTLTIETLC